MKFKLDGRVIEFDETKMLVREARELKHYTGLGLRAFGNALKDGDPDAIVGMLYLAKRRAGMPCQWGDFDDLDIATLDMVTENPEQVAAAEAEAEQAAREAADPTVLATPADVLLAARPVPEPEPVPLIG